MADLTYIQAAQEVKVVGQDSSGNNANFVGADPNGNILAKDVLLIGGQQRAVSLSTSAVEALGAATILTNRKSLTILPTNGTIYWGYTNAVTTATGTPIFKNQLTTFAISDAVHVYIIGTTTTDVRITEGA